MSLSRRGFLGGMFALPVGVALVKAQESDLFVPDKRLVTEIPTAIQRRILEGEVVDDEPMCFKGRITEVRWDTEEVGPFYDSSGMARYFPGLMTTTVTLVGQGNPSRAMHENEVVVIW